MITSLGEALDPAELCARFLDQPYVLLLESAPGASHPELGRYSFLTADPRWVVRSKGRLTEVRGGSDTGWTAAEGDALDVVRRLLRDVDSTPVEGLPPFQGGAAGYIGYDYGGVLERLPHARYDDLDIPDVMLGIYEWVVAWDHRIGAAWVISVGERALERMEWVLGRLASGGMAGTGTPPPDKHTVLRGHSRSSHSSPSLPEPVEPSGRGGLPEDCVRVRRQAPPAAPAYRVVGVPGAESIGLESTFTHRGYLDAVARVRDYIVAGDIFQANLSQRFQAPLRDDPFELYRRLRRRNPAPFAAYLDFGEVAVVSASPERFLQFDPARRLVETRPIKGTRPRGLGPMHDAALGRALAESDKDRAENVMIVDLLRNDLSRVCRPGTVRVPELFALEHHPTVHHLVSTVVGELEEGADAVDLLRAAFPGGSITGAPKIRAMEIIAELEPTRRGVYCGSIGYLAASGAMDTSIVIRTYVARGGRVYFQAGGGIVADSDPEQEYRETLDKARALIEVLSAAD